MALSKIRINLDHTPFNGEVITFKASSNSLLTESLKIYYPNSSGNTVSQVFTLCDAHSNNIGGSDAFKQNAIVKVTLYIDSNNSVYKAFIENEVTNEYIESVLAHKANDADLAPVAKSGKYEDLTGIPSINDQKPTYTQASTLANLTSGEKLSISMGKIMKAIADFISHKGNTSNPHSVTKTQVGLGSVDNTSDANKPVSTKQATAIADAKSAGTTAQDNLKTHTSNTSNPHKVTASQVGAAPASHTHSASDISSGTLGISRGGTGATSATAAATALKVLNLDKGTGIAENDDLNNYKTVGTFYTSGGTISKTIVNTPHTTSNFKLIVFNYGATSYIGQVVVAGTSSVKVFLRVFDGSTWGAWRTVFTNVEVIPIANGGTGATTAAAAKTNLGLDKVPNVSTNDQTPTYTQASTLANIVSGEKLSTSMGKIMKAIADFISHKSNTSNPHSVTLAQIGAAASSHNHAASAITSGTLPIARGGTGATSASSARENLGIIDAVYPVGSIYMSVSSTSPSTLFGGTWERLQDKFLLGAGSTYTAGNTGGEATHTLTASEMPSHTHTGPSHTHTGPSHTHTLSSHTHAVSITSGSAGKHKHTISKQRDGFVEYYHSAGPNHLALETGNYDRFAFYASYNTTEVAAHTHSVSGNTGAPSSNATSSSGTGATGSAGTGNTGSAGSGSSHNNMPPYLVVYMWKRTA